MEVHNKEDTGEDDFVVQHVISGWSPPTGLISKINVDGAWDCKSRVSGLGIIIRNHRGNSVAGASIFASHNSIEEAETNAVLHGILLAAHHNLKDISLECDSQYVVKALRDSNATHNWRISPLLSRINNLLSMFNSVC
ncbi:PREDICTED: uncharacterized protein LOC101291953 [Fragaria vesca subsp. vesca]